METEWERQWDCWFKQRDSRFVHLFNVAFCNQPTVPFFECHVRTGLQRGEYDRGENCHILSYSFQFFPVLPTDLRNKLSCTFPNVREIPAFEDLSCDVKNIRWSVEKKERLDPFKFDVTKVQPFISTM